MNLVSVKKRILNEHDEDDDEIDSCHSFKRVKRSSPACELSELELWKLANKYDNLLEWKQLGTELGLTRCEIQIIESKYLFKDGLVECLYQTLLKWRLKQPENCNLKFIESKIKYSQNSINTFEILEKYIKLLEVNECDITGIRLKEKMLWEISDLICVEWKSISRYLGLRESEIYEIEMKYFDEDGLRECCYQALLKWSVNSIQDNLLFFCTCLIEQSFNFYVKKILELFI